MFHRQVQRHHAVATRRVRQCELRRVRALGVEVAVNPTQAVANRTLINASDAVFHRQVQRYHAVTARCVRQRELRRVRALGVEVAVNPTQAVANRTHVDAGVRVVHRQMQGHHTITACHALQRVRRGVRAHGVEVTVNPAQAVANLPHIDAGGAVFHRQVEGYHTIATRCVRQRELRRVRALRVKIAVNPAQTVANLLHIDAGVRMFHRQVEGHHTVATRHVLQRVGRRVRALGVEVAVNPAQAVANHLLVDAGVRMFHRQVQRHHAITACCALQRVRRGVRACGVEIAVNPAQAVTNHPLVDAGFGEVHRQVQRHNAVAAIDRLSVENIVA